MSWRRWKVFAEKTMRSLPPKSTWARQRVHTRKLELIAQMNAIESPQLVGEVIAAAQRQLLFEQGRQGRLDAKATSLLTVAGLSLTVAFTYGGSMLMNSTPTIAAPGDEAWCRLGIEYGIALLLGLAAAIVAVWALRVRYQFVVTDAAAVIDRDTLLAADAEYSRFVPNFEEGKALDDKFAGARAVAMHQRTLAAQTWLVFEINHDSNSQRGSLIGCGQILFVLFLMVLAVIGIEVAGAAYNRAKPPQSAGPQSTEVHDAGHADGSASGEPDDGRVASGGDGGADAAASESAAAPSASASAP